jgi:hypothetical protein
VLCESIRQLREINPPTDGVLTRLQRARETCEKLYEEILGSG